LSTLDLVTKLTSSRLVAYGFGKGLRIHDLGEVPYPAEIDDEYLSTTEEGVQPRGVPSQLTFFRITHSLSDISDVMFGLRDSTSSDHGSKYLNHDLGMVLDGCARMDKFLEELPAHLQLGSTSYKSHGYDVFQLQARILYSR
jgi:hypothetical protein